MLEWIFLTIALIYPTLMSWIYFVQLQGEGSEGNPNMQLALALGKGLQFILPVLALLIVDRKYFRFGKPKTDGLWQATAFGLFIGAGILFLWWGWLKYDQELLGNAPRKVYSLVTQLHANSFLGFFLLASFISVCHAFLEEYYWRWYVFGRISKHWSFWPAVILSSFAFGFFHIVIIGVYFQSQFWLLVIPFTLCVAIGGGIWAWMYHHYQSIYGIWISHGIVDAALMIVGWDMICMVTAAN